MKASEIRAKAREALTGKWGKVAIITLVMEAIIYALQFLSGFTGGILGIAATIIMVPMEFGLIKAFMKIKKEESVETFDFLKLGFENFGKSWGIVGYTLLKLLVPIAILIVSLVVLIGGIFLMAVAATEQELALIALAIVIIVLGVIGYIASIVFMYVKGLLYTLPVYIACDEEDITAKEAVEKSEKIMKGNRGKYFVLYLSFIGWGILAAFTFGIGLLWLMPYMQFATIIFYEMLAGKDVEVEAIKEEN